MPSPLTIHFDSFKLTDNQFYQLCQDNRNLRFEKNAYGDLVIMPPTGGLTSNKNLRIIQQLANWTDKDGKGIAFDSSGGFKLPNGAIRAPDASWISLKKWQNLTMDEKEKFIPLCPDFVMELRSKKDDLKPLQEKMKEYIDNGTKLGWLINPQDKKVEIYREDKTVEILDSPMSLSGENILVNFVLNLELIW
ncbi:Uma2 family endonuclease [Geminocystis sp. GBBB08]|uniref:Uma2 family endonuclease n=1 Tax=Geminocystis sp. GBBB08 TaxID=2604140 RepID=UPI0027E24CE4|nr:Uma2 family endonuclease [Geminocystis sp. GBBB08]MBL1209410.1 Uma2 family endonuclease [Geminocystis sp. GBBB08]